MVRATLLVALASCVCTSAFVVPNGLRRSMRMGIGGATDDDERSTALPFDKRPANLDGTLPGDAGFDPVGFSSAPPRDWLYGGEGRSLKWYREAELTHGRTAMLAVLGWIVPEFYHLPGNDKVRGRRKTGSHAISVYDHHPDDASGDGFGQRPIVVRGG
jgi:hypothetical protein